MKRFFLLLLLAPVGACGSPAPYSTTEGILRPGASLIVNLERGRLDVYQPAAGQRRDLFTVSATALRDGKAPPPALRARGRNLVVDAGALASLLVRVPTGVNLAVRSGEGDVNVTDIGGNARIAARRGNVTLMLPGYAEATVAQGTLAVTMGAMRWPGTLRFSVGRGDVVLRVPATASFGVHLHTGDGTLFTEFALRGNSAGTAETIDGTVNGGGPQQIWAQTQHGAIRLLRLQPQP
ncbi:MAG: hypothetical protein JO030_03250 [Candidatus Eremiobacteraeota bacterium]|nr:hypothetical protein [Candidatus Eremiobacteraeota bacterium]